MPDDPSRKIELVRYRGTDSATEGDVVAVEEPLEIRVEGRSVAVVMRTPGHDDELATGFLLSEGVVTRGEDIFEISQCPSQSDSDLEKGNIVDVLLRDSASVDFDRLSRHVFSASSCGICGKATIDALFENFPRVSSTETFSSEMIMTLPDRLRAAQRTFEQTGGLHASAVFDSQGEMLVLREDVGRHNALDKVIGHALLNDRLPLKDSLLMLSGRISFELMQKALAAGISLVAGISAPSSLAVDFARESGQVLVGFLRDQGMNVYANADRVFS